jgi:hypothetical protein
MSAALPLLDEARHRYTLNGAVVPGVSEILAPLVPLKRVDPQVLRAAADFGRAVHRACELDDLGTLDEPALDAALLPYLAAWRAFSRDHRVAWSLIEQRVYQPQWGYAGTVDRYGRVNGCEAVVDLKSGAAFHPTVGPQLAAYAKAIPQATTLTRRIGVLLRPSGHYQVQTYTDARDWAVFASLITLRNFCAMHRLPIPRLEPTP